jgi:hypothetical protein
MSQERGIDRGTKPIMKTIARKPMASSDLP